LPGELFSRSDRVSDLDHAKAVVVMNCPVPEAARFVGRI
jgi:hypothetical protein